ncbi:uncharacterized protein METZ01_LOCUS93681 [marine metagenome]|uniref:Uncharacterized protein n=1 Tax=marine metagenome TaxID=408172 RepID=A0A381VME0_9ZZZZ
MDAHGDHPLTRPNHPQVPDGNRDQVRQLTVIRFKLD